jgi:hypothetical protein
MMRQDQRSWAKGRAAGEQGLLPVRPKGLDPLSFASGYVEGKARQRKPAPLRLVPSVPPSCFGIIPRPGCCSA